MRLHTKRHQMKWQPGNCQDHNHCDCDLVIEFPALGLNPIMIKRKMTYRRTVRDMYVEAKAFIVSNYFLHEGVVRPRPMDYALYLEYLRNHETPRSQIALSPPFPVSNEVKEMGIYPESKWKGIFTEVERSYWIRMGYPVYVPFNDEKVIPSLAQLICRKMSWVATVFDKYYGRERVVNTMTYFPLKKQLALYGDFNVDTMKRDAAQSFLWNYAPAALGWLNYQMENEVNFGTCYFDYDPHKLIRKFQIYRSGGIASGGSKHGKFNGEDIIIQASGQKIFMFLPAIRKLHRLMVRVRRGDMTAIEAIICVVKAKHEWKLGQFKNVEELDAMLLKIREFFIPEQWHSFLGILLNENRMLLERNNIIRIGMKFWYGGAECLFRYLNGHMKGFIYVDGDITGLDKHIQDWQLLLYCFGAFPYFDWKTLSDSDALFFRAAHGYMGFSRLF